MILAKLHIIIVIKTVIILATAYNFQKTSFILCKFYANN